VPLTRYAALLRGINVGGKNVIPMKALAACFEGEGMRDVSTYIASGNVLFTTTESNRPKLVLRLERALSTAFSYRSTLVLRSAAELRRAVLSAPRGFGRSPAKFRYDVVFLKDPLTPAEAMNAVRPRPGVDAAHPGPGVLYFSRLVARASQSNLSRLMSTPEYKLMTIRNWNTTTKLVDLIAER